ncbi:5-methylcytosine-specific restriction endonuclease system specificity protein McrC [Aedoeadaptatus coxii]|uniref:5-methylcytosine-specific restriction endonuclease system specificity protein McrC n=1 Tax=Aedoeadaptatus coxii TaxID=755172 RepID=UPI002AD294E5|nr:5-methylcytosine-specific restriction endonuclease system specificity protein McrC [Peptoniphilus coxii]
MIPIQNVYYMLSYAFQILNERGYQKVGMEEFENMGELCAAILVKGVSLQIKRGLGKEYLDRVDTLSSPRGKIDLSASVKERSMLKNKMVCYYDDFSINSYMNRILKTTMDVLMKSDISKERKKQIHKVLIFFSDVESLTLGQINWRITFHRNNQSYQMLIYICYLILNGLLQTSSGGRVKLMDFLDEKPMARLYEKFILEYYRKENPELKASASQIPWNIDDGYMDMLPIMQSDIMLKKGEKTLIIDAKYYEHTMQSRFHTNTLHSANLYQIFTYVKNLDKENTGNISGLLLYAKTDELVHPDNSYKMGGNRIAAKTLDLNCDFSKIKEQLDRIASSL